MKIFVPGEKWMVNMNKTHKYKAGDLVGLVAECMADCKILRRVPKKKGQGFSYIATAVKIHSSTPEETFFGKNKKFTVSEKRIVVKLSHL
jgi:hypothetical protein